MKSRTALNIVAFVLAIIAGISVYVYASSADRRAVESQSPQPIVVTSHEIPAGMTLGLALEQGWVQETKVPKASLPLGALQSLTAANQILYVLQAIPAGQIVFSANLVTKMPQIGPLTVPEGLMAVTVELSDPARVAPFLRPGAEVAVFNTVELTPSKSGLTVSTTRIVLERVLVVGVGEATQTQTATGEQTAPAALVTLAVTQAQAEVLVHSVQTGSLYFALLRDGTVIDSPRSVTDQLIFGTK